jgi:hypothetical protein
MSQSRRQVQWCELLLTATLFAGCAGAAAPDSKRSIASVANGSIFAVNIDPGNDAAWAQTMPSRLKSEGFDGVRLVARSSIQGRIDELKAAGLQVMAVITNESAGYVPWNADFIQIGNEPDDANTAMSPADYANMWTLYRNTYPQFAGRFVMAGLDSGGQNAVDYASAALSAIGNRAPLPDVIAIHPYGKSPGDAQGDFDMMWDAFQIPVIADEWHNEDDTWNFQCMLGNSTDGRSRTWSSVFAYTDAMVPGFGLRDSSGAPKPFYYSLLSAPSDCR